MTGKLTPYRRRLLKWAAESDEPAFGFASPLYGQAARQRSNAIDALMRLGFLSPLIGPTFGRITEAGRAALQGAEDHG